MASLTIAAVPGYRFDANTNLSLAATRERLSKSAVEGLFAIAERWELSIEQIGTLLGGMPKSTVYKIKTAAGTRSQDELTRISYLVGIYKALHILLPAELADGWMLGPNDGVLFEGRTPLEYVIEAGIPGLQRVRSLLDQARGGR